MMFLYFQELILAFGEINKDAAMRIVESMENKLHLKKLDLNGKKTTLSLVSSLNQKHCFFKSYTLETFTGGYSNG